MKGHVARMLALLQRAAELLECPGPVILPQQDQHLSIRSKFQLRLFEPQAIEPLAKAADEPLLGREVVGFRDVDRIADTDRLVVGDIPELRLAILEGPEAELRGDLEFLRCRM